MDDGNGSGSGFFADPMPLDAVRSTFGWLVSGPAPLSVDGSVYDGFPARAVALDEVRSRLLNRSCPQSVRDAVWAELVARARAAGGGPDGEHVDEPAAGARPGVDAATWMVGCAGVALPALIRVAAILTRRFAADPRDIHAAVLTGFVTELAVVDLGRERIMLRLRWAAYRAGLAAVHDALAAPVPAGHHLADLGPTVPPVAPLPGGHPDLVLARAVTDGVVSADEAALIAATRLDGVDLTAAARLRGARLEATKKARRRAEQRLRAYLAAVLDDTDDAELRSDPVAATVVRTVVGAASPGPGQSRSVTGTGRRRRRNLAPDMSRSAALTGVQGRGRPPAPPSPPPPPDLDSASGPDPAADPVGPMTDPSVQEPRCA